MNGIQSQSQTISVLGAGAAFALLPQPPNVNSPGLICALSAGASMTYQIEVTGDKPPSSTGNWAPVPGLTGLTASSAPALGMVVTGVRPNITTYGSGSLTFQLVQPVFGDQ